uniref:MBOAT family O-acyltransferase n=1 Tax=Aquiflexum sp. TaxID=1872584 RepID=UPI00359450F7
LYWFVFKNNLKAQNGFILLASYVFYGWWDWRFLGLIAFSSLVDYICGLKIGDAEDTFKRKVYLGISLGVNLGLLGFFKYFNFFIESATDLINTAGFQANPYSLQLILPVGISFYTFQTMSYTIDIYRRQMMPTKDAVAFFAYVSFFPQLVAGPIERAANLLPQFFKRREFIYERGTEGLKLILWGLFKKVVIADNCAMVVNPIFANYSDASGLELVLGAVLFAFQIYGDFSGYSDIAIGTGKLLGYDLMTNFRTPYFSRDIAEFWRRWHISLSTWFRDYVYIPLGGSQLSEWLSIRNIFFIFLVSGFWHGANWTFVFWGGLNAIYFIPVFLQKKNRRFTDNAAEGKYWPSLKESGQITFTFGLICFAWIFFRSASITDAFAYIQGIYLNPFLPQNFGFISYDLRLALLLFILLEWVGRIYGNWLFMFPQKRWRYAAYASVLYAVIFWGVFSEPVDFIYFQF